MAPSPTLIPPRFQGQPMGHQQQDFYHQHENHVIPGVWRGQPQEQHQPQMVFGAGGGQSQTTHHQAGWMLGSQQANAQPGFQQQSSVYGSASGHPRSLPGAGYDSQHGSSSRWRPGDLSMMSQDSRPGGEGQVQGPANKNVASTPTQQQSTKQEPDKTPSIRRPPTEGAISSGSDGECKILKLSQIVQFV